MDHEKADKIMAILVFIGFLICFTVNWFRPPVYNCIKNNCCKKAQQEEFMPMV